jgi:hypothetical protein
MDLLSVPTSNAHLPLKVKFVLQTPASGWFAHSSSHGVDHSIDDEDDWRVSLQPCVLFQTRILVAMSPARWFVHDPFFVCRQLHLNVGANYPRVHMCILTMPAGSSLGALHAQLKEGWFFQLTICTSFPRLKNKQKNKNKTP